MNKPRHMLRRYLKERERELIKAVADEIPGSGERLSELRAVIRLCEDRGRF